MNPNCDIILLGLDRLRREIRFGLGNQFAAKASYVNGLNHRIFRGLPLKSVIEILGIRRAEMRPVV
jgi:hypothetical protein